MPPAVWSVAPDLAVNRHAREEDRVVRALARGLDLGRSAVAGEYASWKINLHRGRHGPGHLLTNLLGRIVRGPVADRLAGLLREVLHDVPAGENAAGLRGAFIRLHVREPQALLLLEFGPQGVRIKLQNIKETCDDIQNKMYYLILDYLKNNGYNHYELSNFAKEKYESRHNLTYWNNDNYYGFGAGASGFVNNVRYDNTKSVFKYNAGITRVYEEKLSINELMKDEVMLSLRKISGINKDIFYKKYDVLLEDVFDYKDLVRNNFLTETGKYVYIKEDKLFVSNEIIIMMLDAFKY